MPGESRLRENCTSGSEGRAEVAAHGRRLPRPDSADRRDNTTRQERRARTSSMHVMLGGASDECRDVG
jgi:hypothetical protein